MTIKESLLQQCEAFINNRLSTVENTIKEIQNALTTETKSSAGDKHETGRAMLQLEREKAGNQLAEIQKVKKTLSKIDLDKPSNKIGIGSLVFTSQANYFITISAGELKFENKLFYAISAYTPIGKLLISKKVGDTVEFKDNSIHIMKIL